MSRLAGELVTETLDFDGGRQVTAYVPPASPEAIVFSGDGQSIASWGAFAFDHDRFAAHEVFFVEDVRRWAQSRFGVALPTDRTVVFGVSAGGEFALAMGLRHPDIYGTVLCASPGAGYQPPAEMPRSLPRAYLVAGSQEPFFLGNAIRWAGALRNAGADVVTTERVGRHGGAFWQEEFPLMLAWALGAELGDNCLRSRR